MSVNELPSPGVEVVQVFRATSPTIVTPTLPACVVGVAKQVVDVMSTTSGSSTLNGDALVSLPAFFIADPATGSPAVYTGLDGLILALSIVNSPTITVTVSGNSLTPASLAAQIQTAFDAAGQTNALAEVLEDDSIRVRTVGVGDFQSIRVMETTSIALAAALGISIGYTYVGRSQYDQYDLVVPPTALPDPRNNLDELSIELDTVRAWLALGNGTELKEVLRTEAYLRSGSTNTAAIRTGNVALTGLSYSTPASHTGSANVTLGALYGAGGSLNGLTLVIGTTTLTFNGNTTSASLSALLAAITSTFTGLVATQSGNNLKIATSANGTPATFTIQGSSTSLVALGLTAATYTGTNGTITTGTLIVAIDGAAQQTVTFSYPADATALLGQINSALSPDLTATMNGSNFLVLTTTLVGALASLQVVGGTAMATVGHSAGTTTGTSAVAAIDDNNGDVMTSFLSFNGEDFTAAASVATLTGSVNLTTLTYPGDVAGKTITLSDGTYPQSYTLGSPGSAAALAAELDAFFPDLQIDVSSNNLRIRSTATGKDGMVRVVAGTLLSVVGLTAGATAYGNPKPPLAGDELWIDGSKFGLITQVAPSGAATLKVDKFVAIDADYGANWVIVAKGLNGTATATRPAGNLVIDLLGNIALKHNILRDTVGEPVAAGRANLYISYRAVRKDVTAVAANPGLLRASSTTDLATQLAPLTTDNPLGLAGYFALLNAPETEITLLGVDEVSPDSPYGTVEAFTRAAEYLEAYEVYGVAPLTHEETVAQIFSAHAVAMSEPEMKGERICLFNFDKPTKKVDTLVASGTNGNSNAATTFDTGIVNLPQLALAAGVNPVGTIPVSAGLFLDIASDSKHYSVSAISGSVVTIRTSFTAGQNDDAFYATTDLNDPPLTSQLVEEAFALRVRGAALVLADGVTPDRANMAITYAQRTQSYAHRRFWSIVPDKAAAVIDGLEQTIEGFYMCAGVAGMISKQPPQQSFTNFPMTGYTKVIGSNDFFSVKQLNQIAGGGNYIVVQTVPGGALMARYAITSDLTSLESRTDSITKVVDFTAKFLRGGLKNFIGRFNITQGLLDSLGQVLAGMISFLSDAGVLIGAKVERIIQDEDNPNTVIVDVELDVPYPCDFIRLTLVV